MWEVGGAVFLWESIPSKLKLLSNVTKVTSQRLIVHILAANSQACVANTLNGAINRHTNLKPLLYHQHQLNSPSHHDTFFENNSCEQAIYQVILKKSHYMHSWERISPQIKHLAISSSIYVSRNTIATSRFGEGVTPRYQMTEEKVGVQLPFGISSPHSLLIRSLRVRSTVYIYWRTLSATTVWSNVGSLLTKSLLQRSVAAKP